MSSERLYATGRRKTSSARIYLSQGEGSIKVNNKELSDYFGREVAQMLVKQPLELCNLIDKVDIVAKVKGGGSFGQAGAIRHGISRALLLFDEELKTATKKSWFSYKRFKKSRTKKAWFKKGKKELTILKKINIIYY